MWSQAPAGWTHDSQFMPMVRVDVRDKTGEQAAVLVKHAIGTRMAAPNPTLEVGKIALLLQNYASDEQWYYDNGTPNDNTDDVWVPFNSTCALTRSVDQVSMPTWNDPTDLISENPRMQVWCTNGANPPPSGGHLADWTADFLQHYEPANPVINRFHLDSEMPFAICCSANQMLLISRLPQDPRWNTLPVPGFGMMTLANLWFQETIAWGEPGLDLANSIVTNQSAAHPLNRRVFLWYNRIAQKARAAVLGFTTFVPWTNRFPQIRHSNYEDTLADGQPDTFGWFYDWSAVGSLELANTSGRGFAAFNNLGFQNAAGLPKFPTYEDSGRFVLNTGHIQSNESSPVLYYWSTDHIQHDAYRVASVMETQWQASLRQQRRWLESIINTAAAQNSSPETTVSPWIPMVGTIAYFPGFYQFTRDDVSRQMSLLRSKGIRTALVWQSNEPGDPITFQYWCEFEIAERQVFTPEITSVAVTPGGGSAPGTLEPKLVDDTLRHGTPTGWHATVTGQASGLDWVAGMEFEVKRLHETPGCGLRLHIECGVDRAGALTRLYLWDYTLPGGGNWQIISIPYGSSSTVTNAIEYVTPDHTTRRVIDVPSGAAFVNPQGHMKVRLVSTSPYSEGDAPLAFSVDLIQVNRIDGQFGSALCYPACGVSDMAALAPPPEFGRSGADIDLNGVVTDHDMAIFFGGLQQGTCAADYDQNGLVNDADFDSFTSDFIAGGG